MYTNSHITHVMAEIANPTKNSENVGMQSDKSIVIERMRRDYDAKKEHEAHGVVFECGMFNLDTSLTFDEAIKSATIV